MASGQESKIRYVAVGVTNVGRVREHNEDNFLLVDLALDQRGESGKVLSGPVAQRGLSLVVADGMGGAAAGEVASKMAVDGLHGEFKNADLGGTVRAEPDVIGLLETAINKANEAIFRLGQESKEHQGMGTTLTASVVLGDSLYLSQVGDSRGYILRKGKLVQMTRDQSLIGQLIEEGTLTEEQAEKLGGKNIILQALGVEETLKIDSKRYEILRGDTLLLCSDGLSGMVPDAQMEQILTAETDLGTAAGKLIEAANANGGKDNITVVLARFEGEGLREPLQPLTDAEKTGGSFHAPPPPKSNAGRNAVLATAGLLAVVAAWLFWPKDVLLKVLVGPANATVTIKGAPDGGPAGFEKGGTTEPGKPLELAVPRGAKFLLAAEAPGYERQERPLSTDVEFAEMEESFTLARTPARSLDVVPPSVGGKRLSGVRVSLVALEDQPPVAPVVVLDGGAPEFSDRFNAGRWKGTAERRGFQTGEIKEFDVPSGAPFVLQVPPLEEVRGTVVVTQAPPGAEVMILDGEEPLLAAPEKVGATRSTPPLSVRATEVTVQVTKAGHRPFSARVAVEKDRVAPAVSMANHGAQVVLRAPVGARMTLRSKDRPSAAPVRIPAIEASGKSDEQWLDPGSYDVLLRPKGAVEDEPARTLVVEPGQILEVEVGTLPR